MSGSGGIGLATRVPSSDELEITVLGGGTGESVVVHLGDSQWLIVDSFLDGDVPAAERYLRSIGADLDRVRMILVTHWHDDHVRGAGQLLRSCPRASLGCPVAFQNREVIAFIEARDGTATRSVGGSCKGQIRDAFRIAGDDRIELVMAGVPLFRSDPPLASIVALSPGSVDIIAVQAQLAAARRGDRNRMPARFPNDMSIALHVSLGDAHALLGADLEAPSDPHRGWKAALASAPAPDPRPDFVKVPHHGSVDAHEPGMWNQFLAAEPTAVVTGWQGPKRYRPTPTDLARLCSLSSSVWLAGHPASLLTALASGGQLIRIDGVNVGSVTARHGAAGWRVSSSGAATQMCP